MCQTPQKTPDGKVFACRTCDACIAQRRMDWVARAMAERACHPFTTSITLTYADETQHQRDGAAMFRYSDIQLFLKSLRRKIHYDYGQTGLLRYIVAGEQGDKNGRCHWHIIIFSDIDILSVGEFSRFGKVVTDRADIISEIGTDANHRRRHWDMWQHGFVVVQEPDEGGMHYALTYALKDQFSGLKTKGTGREGRSETFATGIFRMSKNPPIGEPFILGELQRLADRGSVLPKPTLIVPDCRGFWWPKGKLRELLLTGLRKINDTILASTGRNAPQWTSLLSACSKSDKDMEYLNGKEEEEGIEEVCRDILTRSALREADKQSAKIRRECGAQAPCTRCLYLFSMDIGAFKVSPFEQFDGIHGTAFRYKKGDPLGENLQKAQAKISRSGINPYCQKKQEPPQQRAFPASNCG